MTHAKQELRYQETEQSIGAGVLEFVPTQDAGELRWGRRQGEPEDDHGPGKRCQKTQENFNRVFMPDFAIFTGVHDAMQVTPSYNIKKGLNQTFLVLTRQCRNNLALSINKVEMILARHSVGELCVKPEVVFTGHVENDVGAKMSIHPRELNRFAELGIGIGDFHGDRPTVNLFSRDLVDKCNHEMVRGCHPEPPHERSNIVEVGHSPDTFADLAADNEHLAVSCTGIILGWPMMLARLVRCRRRHGCFLAMRAMFVLRGGRGCKWQVQQEGDPQHG